MKRVGLVLVLAAGACGGGDDDVVVDHNKQCPIEGGEECFLASTDSMGLDGVTATMIGDTADTGPANWNCAPDSVMTSTVEIAVTGEVRDFQEDDLLPGVLVEAFLDASDFSTPVTTATTDMMGGFTLTLPSGMALSRMNWRTSYADALDTYEINDPFDIADGTATISRYSVSNLTAAALPAFIGVTRTPGLGVLAGAVRDCDGVEVAHAFANIATQSGRGLDAPTGFIAGAQIYYFSNLDPDLPVKRNLGDDTNNDGLFVIVEIPPTTGSETYFLQAWGYKTAADATAGTLSLLSEFETVVVGDSVIIVDMDPTEGM